ncbi:MAG: Flp pilus assembly complex ATPase component TadA [Magnetococcus sp. WYHC-3]
MELKNKKVRLGDLLVENGIITDVQLQLALSHQKTTGVKLGQALLELKLVTDAKLHRFLAQQRRKVRIGDALVNNQVITEEQLKRALAEQKKTGKKLGQTLAYLGILSEHQFLNFLAQQIDLPFVDLKAHQFDTKVTQILPENHARRFRAIALSVNRDAVLVGMADPTDIFVYDELTQLLKRPPQLALVSETDLLQTLDRLYRRKDDILQQAEEMSKEVAAKRFSIDELVQDDMAVDAPVVKILNSLFEDALAMNASDIHIEPDEDVLRVRQRIDGVLQEQIIKEKQIAPSLISKLKLMSGLEIAEKRLPQDGRFNINVRDRSIDVRVSTLPIQDGESVVMRLLKQDANQLTMQSVGMRPWMLEKFQWMITRPHGLVLVTGPTGSGKTTTLYGALNYLNQPEKKIITCEDPVEYRLPRINQVQVRPKIGLTFASVLRTVLRQDPDIVLVGEMRDKETAEIAIRAALTGHMVLSTLHTNDAVSTAIRLVEMGLEGFAVAAALRGILAQRLIRRICRECREEYQPSDQEEILVRGMLGVRDDGRSFHLFRGKGCQHCNGSGYAGRVAVIEMLEMRRDLADALRRNDTEGFIQIALRQRLYVPLHLAALEYAMEGVTSLSEVLKLSSDADEDDKEAKPPLSDAGEVEDVAVTADKDADSNNRTPAARPGVTPGPRAPSGERKFTGAVPGGVVAPTR